CVYSGFVVAKKRFYILRIIYGIRHQVPIPNDIGSSLSRECKSFIADLQGHFPLIAFQYKLQELNGSLQSVFFELVRQFYFIEINSKGGHQLIVGVQYWEAPAGFQAELFRHPARNWPAFVTGYIRYDHTFF